MDPLVPVVAIATAMVLLVALGNKARIAYPIVLVLSGLALGLVFVALLVVLAANGYAPATSLLVVVVAGFLMISIGSMMRGGAR